MSQCFCSDFWCAVMRLIAVLTCGAGSAKQVLQGRLSCKLQLVVRMTSSGGGQGLIQRYAPAQVENVDQVERLFDFISPLVKDMDQGAEEPDDEVHLDLTSNTMLTVHTAREDVAD
jgi:hypothetical protein